MTQTVRIVLAQTNFHVGNVAANVKNIIELSLQARDQLHAQIIVFPELSLVGYPPEDLLLRAELHQHITDGLYQIQHAAKNIAIIVGYPQKIGDDIFNTVSVFSNEQHLASYQKQNLPNYGVFDEKRYFKPGKQATVVELYGLKIGLVICEDLWYPEPIAQAAAAGAQIIISPNASPFHSDKSSVREAILQQRIQEVHLPIFYAHWVAGQDELVFDGGSMVMNHQGVLCAHAGFFTEKLLTVDLEVKPTLKIISSTIPAVLSEEERIYNALVLSVRDYLTKNKAQGALIGLSGGIDSALTLAIAVDALGAENVEVVMMPSRYNAEISLEDAIIMANNFGVKHHVISIEPIFQTFLTSLANRFAGLAADLTEENLQSRCRGVLLMAISNKTGKWVLTTGNKSEMAVGYSTLYGDTAGAFAVLKDVLKTMVYRLVKYRNKIKSVIPERVITRPPSAELAPDQIDQDSLPPYPQLDKIIQAYVEHDRSAAEIIATGFDKDVVERVIKLIDRSEYKRRQTPPGPRITEKAFGRDRRYPITSGFHSQFKERL